MFRNNLPGHRSGCTALCEWRTSYVRISTVLRPRSPTTSTSAAVLMSYRQDGTAVASSVSFLFRDNTFEVRAVPLHTAIDATAASIAEITWKTLGLRGGPRTPDPWPDICAADVVIIHPGQSCEADYELLWSLSFALTATAWRRIGGFYDRYRGYGAEDTDFALTARAARDFRCDASEAHMLFLSSIPCRIPR